MSPGLRRLSKRTSPWCSASRSSPPRAAATTTTTPPARKHRRPTEAHRRRDGRDRRDRRTDHRRHGPARPTPGATDGLADAGRHRRLPGDRRLRRRRPRHRRRALAVGPASAPPTRPLAAEGEPIVIGLQNPEGDPDGSFPEFTHGRRGRRRVHQRRARRLGRRHPERRAGPADPARGVQDGHLAGRLAALRQRAAHQGPVHRRLDDQLLRQPPADLPGRRHAGRRDVAGDDRRLHVRRAPTPSAAAAAASACTPASSSSPPPTSRPSGSPCRGPTRRPAWSATTTSRPSRSTCSTARSPGDVRAGRLDARPGVPRRADQAGDAGRDAAGHRDPRLRARRDHVLRPGCRLLEPRRRARPPRLDARGASRSCCPAPAPTSRRCAPPAAGRGHLLRRLRQLGHRRPGDARRPRRASSRPRRTRPRRPSTACRRPTSPRASAPSASRR